MNAVTGSGSGVVSVPLDLVGVPYQRGGVTPETGFDCFTLMAYVRRRWFGRESPVGELPHRALSTSVLCAVMLRRALGSPLSSAWEPCEPSEGVAVALGMRRFGRLHHCGVRVAGGVLHALEGAGVVWAPGNRIDQLYSRVEYYECRVS